MSLQVCAQNEQLKIQWLNSCTGITVGLVVIPQGMAYAKLAQLPVEFGLYTYVLSQVIELESC